jgi:nucleoside-diphosphate-sugar epimerase
MRILVTGHAGYIGTVLVPMFQDAGHDVVGLDSGLFDDCVFGGGIVDIPATKIDVRDVTVEHLEGFDAVVHLAALSNDPLGDLNPGCTFHINHEGSVHMARTAKAAGVPRFLQSSTCSLYGAHGDNFLDEHAEFLPVTPYGQAKVLAERDILALADDDFSPTFLRNATAYGMSPRLRGDLVVNNLTGYALTTGEVFMKSDGTPWRPLVHIRDISAAFLAIAEAERELVHAEAFNVGSTEENYQVRDVAAIVEANVPGSRIALADEAGPDLRNYRVNCDKLASTFPDLTIGWTVERGVQELVDAYRANGLTLEDLTGDRLQRIARIRTLLDAGEIDNELRWQDQHVAAARA